MVYGKVLNEITLSNLRYRNITGRKIRYYRVQKGIKEREFSENLKDKGIDITENMVKRLERGSRLVTDIELYYIAKILNVNIDILFDIKNEFPLYTKDIYDESAILEQIITINGRKNIVGKAIKEYRKNARMKQTDLERKMILEGVYIRRLGEIEEGIRMVTDMELYYFAKVLNKSINSFYNF